LIRSTLVAEPLVRPFTELAGARLVRTRNEVLLVRAGAVALTRVLVRDVALGLACVLLRDVALGLDRRLLEPTRTVVVLLVARLFVLFELDVCAASGSAKATSKAKASDNPIVLETTLNMGYLLPASAAQPPHNQTHHLSRRL
jgi:hypothetical protein